MLHDEVAAAVLVGSFAAWATLHALLCAKLVFVAPRWRGVVAFVVAPLAPYWGARAGFRLRAAAWVSTLAVWILARLLLSR